MDQSLFTLQAVQTRGSTSDAHLREYDIAHIHGLYRFPPTYAAWQARKQGVPYIIQPHGSLDSFMYARSSLSVPLKRLYECWFDFPNLHAAGAIHYTAEDERERAAFLKLRAPSFVVAIGVEWQRFENLPSRGAFRSAHKLGDALLVLFLGRLLQRWIVSGLRLVQRIVCVSRQTAHELQKAAGIVAAKVSIVLNALNYPYVPMPQAEATQRVRAIGLPSSQPYVLHVGGNDWYKNRVGVVRIFAELVKQSSYQEHRLVLAGKAWDADLAALVAGSDLAGRIDAVDDADNETLRALYSRADFLLFPSLAEGFGWPIAEAMACGCPVVTTGREPMTEVGGEAALYLDDPTDAAGCARRIVDAMGPRERRVALGFAQAARFDTASMLAGYLEVVAQVTSEGD